MSETENSKSKETRFKSFSSEIVEVNNNPNRYVKPLLVITSVLIIMSVLASFGMSFVNHRVSNILLSYDNEQIKFQLNRVILYMFFGFFSVTKGLVITSLCLNQDNYLLEVLYKCKIFIILLSDLIMSASINIGTFVKNIEVMIITSIIIGAVEMVSLKINIKL